MNDISSLASSQSSLAYEVSISVAAKSQNVAKAQAQAALSLLDAAVKLQEQAGPKSKAVAAVTAAAGRLDVTG